MISELLKSIHQNYPQSTLNRVLDSDLTEVANRYKDIPTELIELYKEIGVGSIGNSSYMIHFFIEPIEIYDEDTAKELYGVLIVGDDCAAYDTKNDWKFGTIGSDNIFEPYHDKEYGLVDLLCDWFVKT